MSRTHRTTPTWRRRFRLLGALLAVAAMTATVGTAAGATSDPSTKPTIVLVHGAFADASGWNEVTERLQDRDYTVIAPANPLRGVDSDSAYLASILDTIEGPIVLVGHSYGGFVMTNAAAGKENVRALVYIAAFAPDTGDTVGALTAMNPGSGLGDPANLVIRPHPGGVDAYINPAVFHEVFAADVDEDTAAVMAASQRAADAGTLDQSSGEPAWNTIPSWYMVANEDKTIPPATERFMAERGGATTVEIESSHVAMISHPKQVTKLILEAARTTTP